VAEEAFYLKSAPGQRIAYKLAVITYRTRSTGTPVYLTDLIKNSHPSRAL